MRGQERMRRLIAIGGASPRAVVVTTTFADCPAVSVLGITEQVTACAGRVHVALTDPANPLSAFTVITFVNVAVWPALTVCEAWPAATLNEKSGGPVTMKLKGADVPAGGASTT